MVDLEKLEEKFRKKGWEKYLINLYKWTIEEKDINILINCIEKIETLEEKVETIDIPFVTLENVKRAKIRYNPSVIGYDIESEDDIDIEMNECPKDYEPFGDGNSFGCKKK